MAEPAQIGFVKGAQVRNAVFQHRHPLDAETEGEAIRYQIATPRDFDEMGPCILAGPSCDSADVLYEKQPVQLPVGLAAGDRIVIRCCGAYTSTYASIGFNGFPPLDVVAI